MAREGKAAGNAAARAAGAVGKTGEGEAEEAVGGRADEEGEAPAVGKAGEGEAVAVRAARRKNAQSNQTHRRRSMRSHRTQ